MKLSFSVGKNSWLQWYSSKFGNLCTWSHLVTCLIRSDVVRAAVSSIVSTSHMLVKVNQRKLICYDDKSLKLIYLPTRAVFSHKAQIMWAAGLSARPAEACITERATVSYEHETSSSDNSWLWPQDGSNIKDGGKREELYDSAVREKGGHHHFLDLTWHALFLSFVVAVLAVCFHHPVEGVFHSCLQFLVMVLLCIFNG